MNILLTGCAGFIGSHLCERLLSQGHSVVGLDDLSAGKMENLKIAEKNTRFRFVQGDCLDESLLVPLMRDEKIDTVFHFAANSEVRKSLADPNVDLQRTLMTTFHVLGAMKKAGVKKIVFASSSTVYGVRAGALREDEGPFLPISHYGACKLASEALLSVAISQEGVQAWVFRFPNVVGSRAGHGVIYDFIQKLRADPTTLQVLGDGNQLKPYIHVSDLLEAIDIALEKSHAPLNLFNIAPPTRTYVREIAQEVVKSMGGHAVIRYENQPTGWVGDVPSFEYDTSRICSLGWRAKLDSTQAVKRAINELSV